MLSKSSHAWQHTVLIWISGSAPMHCSILFWYGLVGQLLFHFLGGWNDLELSVQEEIISTFSIVTIFSTSPVLQN